MYTKKSCVSNTLFLYMVLIMQNAQKDDYTEDESNKGLYEQK